MHVELRAMPYVNPWVRNPRQLEQLGDRCTHAASLKHRNDKKLILIHTLD